MQLLIAGDLVPTESNIDLFKTGNALSLLGKELYSIWKGADFRIFNLETPLVDEPYPIQKCGPNLIATPEAIKGIKALDPSLITLANNHILDQGLDGLNFTKNILDKNKVPFIGVGNNTSEASAPYIIEKDGIKLGVYACAEHEFSIVTDELAGANPFDPLESLDHIYNLKTQCNHVIVLYHGGKEQYRYPSPYLQKVCRKMIEKGADLVVCQHSHCVGSYEEHDGGTAVYGQGNFIFNKYDNEFWNTGMIIQVDVEDQLKINYIPIVRNERAISLADETSSQQILLEFNKRSKEILSKDFIEKQYKKISQANLDFYLRSFSGFNKWLSRVDRHLLKGKLLEKRYNKKTLLKLLNNIECEAHRELIIMGLKSRL